MYNTKTHATETDHTSETKAMTFNQQFKVDQGYTVTPEFDYYND